MDIQIKDEWLQAIEHLSTRMQGEILYAITTYTRTGNEPASMKPTIRTIFLLIKREIDISRARAESGRRGGMSESNPQANAEQTLSKSQANLKQTLSKPQANPKQKPSKSQANAEQTPSKENKDDIPPTPPIEENKEKENISIDIQKKNPVQARRQKFYDQLATYTHQYPKEMLRQFYDYWSELNKSGTRMRFELERTWDINLRLSRWARNQKTDPSAYSTGTILQPDPDRYTNPQEQELAW